MTKFEEFKKNYEEAVATIEMFLQPTQYNPPMHGLVKWMMETDANPYSYLPHNWAGSMSSAESFAGLLHYISHALYDDGEITFVAVNGEPRIVFVWKHECSFRELVLTEQEQRLEKDFAHLKGSSPYDVTVLDIKPEEFGDLYDEYQREWLKRCFKCDSRRGGKAILDHYRKYKLWDDSMIPEEFLEEMKNADEGEKLQAGT